MNIEIRLIKIAQENKLDDKLEKLLSLIISELNDEAISAVAAQLADDLKRLDQQNRVGLVSLDNYINRKQEISNKLLLEIKKHY